jgi:hypothetical protein
MRIALFGIGAALLLGGSAAAQDQMTGEELQAALSGGKTISLGGKGQGYSGELILNADGTGSGTAKTDDGSKQFTMTGTWRIEGGQFCRTWKEFNDGKEVCEDWVKTGDNMVDVMVDGEKIGTNHW